MIPEFNRIIRVLDVGSASRSEQLAATLAERLKLAARFDLLELDRLTADLVIQREAGGIRVRGRIAAGGAQACVVSAQPVAFTLDEPVDLRFSNEALQEGDEVELGQSDLDTLPLDGDELDLGETVAQSLGLALDPYPRGAETERAEAARFVISEEEAEARDAAAKTRASPFGTLRGGS